MKNLFEDLKTRKDRWPFLILAVYALCVYGPMAMMSIGAGVVLAGWLYLHRGRLLEDLRGFANHSLFWPSVLLVVAGAWSLVWARISGLEFYGEKPPIEWAKDLKKSWHMVFPFLLCTLAAELSVLSFRRLLKWWMLLGLASAVLGIVQHYVPLVHPLELPDVGLRGLYHATGMTGFHLSYASIMAFPTAAWMAFFAVLYRREGVSKRSMSVLAVCFLFFIANIFTYSKIVWAAVPATAVLLLIVGLKGWLRWSLVALIFIFMGYWVTSPQTALRFKGTDTIKERKEVWSANIEMIRQFPVFGVGWHHNSELAGAYYKANNMRGFQSHAHNNIVDQWATTGLIGLFFFVWLCGGLVWLSWQIYVSSHDLMIRSLGLGFLGGWFCLHVNGLTQTNFWDAKVMHQIGWVMALTMEAHRRFKASKSFNK